jgi:hypothetical protein
MPHAALFGFWIMMLLSHVGWVAARGTKTPGKNGGTF